MSGAICHFIPTVNDMVLLSKKSTILCVLNETSGLDIRQHQGKAIFTLAEKGTFVHLKQASMPIKFFKLAGLG